MSCSTSWNTFAKYQNIFNFIGFRNDLNTCVGVFRDDINIGIDKNFQPNCKGISYLQRLYETKAARTPNAISLDASENEGLLELR